MKLNISFGNLALSCILLCIIGIISSCNTSSQTKNPKQVKIDVIFDTDANNEVDDQHALAYMLFNGDHFAMEGVTVNATSSYANGHDPSEVSGHYDEAKRIMELCGVWGSIPLLTGAQGSFDEIKNDLDNPEFDGHEAVNFIIEQAMRPRDQKLVLLPVGKLTNIALALMKEPRIAERVKIVWLGSNYPQPGEHNMDWDIPSMNYVLDVDVPFEMVIVRYGDPSGTDAVKASQAQILHRMKGKGPRLETPIVGRHGGDFFTWGDYSAELFSKYEMWGDPKGRALFDLAACAILKNPAWAESYEIAAPTYIDGKWIERPDNQRTITIWEWFDIYGIMNDFFISMDQYTIAERPVQ